MVQIEEGQPRTEQDQEDEVFDPAKQAEVLQQEQDPKATRSAPTARAPVRLYS